MVGIPKEIVRNSKENEIYDHYISVCPCSVDQEQTNKRGVAARNPNKERPHARF